MDQINQKLRSITIDFIPKAQMRYDTQGDWLFDGFGNLHILVASQEVPLYNIPIAIHELIEAVLCSLKGITQEQVDEWDFEYPNLCKKYNTTNDTQIASLSLPDEPGEHPGAPYFEQHQIASDVESLLIDRLEASNYIDTKKYWNDTK